MDERKTKKKTTKENRNSFFEDKKSSARMTTNWSRPIKRGICFLMFVCALLVAADVTHVDFGKFVKRGDRFFDIWKQMIPLDMSFTGKVVHAIVTTLAMSIAGTGIGAFLGIWIARACTKGVSQYGILRILVKVLINLIRTIPVIILALASTFLFGVGSFAGTVAIAIQTMVILAKLGYEDMEIANRKTYEVLKASGCSHRKCFLRTILPEVLPGYLTNTLYLLEANVRQAAILGYVGAGGIGILLNEKVTWRDYPKVGIMLLCLYAVVILMEQCSQKLRLFLESDKTYSARTHWSVVIGITLLILSSACLVGLPQVTSKGAKVVHQMIYGMTHPTMALLCGRAKDGVFYMMWETVCIAFLGTVVGVVLAAPLSIAASKKLMPKPVAVVVRLFLMAIRTIPVFIYGLMFLRVTGPGPFAGTMTLGICSIGLLSKRFLIAIDNLDYGAWKAYEAMGIGRVARIRQTILPQLFPAFTSAALYRFDVNLREASILGIVGAGGIGAPL
ncbi:MAG: ABC transporter permease subunit, partial [Clostridiales bacterium]|nr:ABC transporter permease subunit [Clostridiales bacterium]